MGYTRCTRRACQVQRKESTLRGMHVSLAGLLGHIFLRFHEHQPVTGVVPHHRLDPVRTVGRLLQEGDALAAQLIEGPSAVVHAQAEASELALLELALDERC